MKDGVGSRGHLNALVRQLQQGVRTQLLLDQPHLVLLHRDFYEANLQEPLARWALYFFVPWLIVEASNESETTIPQQSDARAKAWTDLIWLAGTFVDDDDGLYDGPVRINDGTPGANAQKRVEDALLAYVVGRERELRFGGNPAKPGYDKADELDELTCKLISLARQWLTSLVPHVLSKRNKIEFGLLPRESWVNRTGSKPRSRAKTMGRKLLAVPYVGKDTPSEAAEFSSPDVIVGFTILAYNYEGLRAVDVRALLIGPSEVVELGGKCEFAAGEGERKLETPETKTGDRQTPFTGLRAELKAASGPIYDRPAYKRFTGWVTAGRKAYETRVLEAHEADGEDGGDGKDGSVADGDDKDGGSALQPWVEPVPLDLIEPSVEEQVDAAHRAIGSVRPTVLFYITSYVFPRCLKYYRAKLQASGIDLGSNVLFDTRLGFSGTPSNLLAPSLVPCAFQPGTQAKVLHTLLNPSILSLKRKRGAWVPKDLLKMVLVDGYNALIDTGALITGLDNSQVAKYIMQNDKHGRFDAAVFIDRTGERVFITKSNLDEPKKIGQCGVPLARRFTFYDQAHVTGTDIKQATAARALATIGKGVIFRDHCQAVWRMRGIEKGQQVVVVIVDQVAKLIEKELEKKNVHVPRDPVTREPLLQMSTVIHWLLVNHLEVRACFVRMRWRTFRVLISRRRLSHDPSPRILSIIVISTISCARGRVHAARAACDAGEPEHMAPLCVPRAPPHATVSRCRRRR